MWGLVWLLLRWKMKARVIRLIQNLALEAEREPGLNSQQKMKAVWIGLAQSEDARVMIIDGKRATLNWAIETVVVWWLRKR